MYSSINNLKQRWEQVQKYWEKNFQHSNPEIVDVLFIVGLNETQHAPTKHLSKEEKLYYINYGLNVLLAQKGYVRKKENSWEFVQALPYMEFQEQTNFLRELIVRYFIKKNLI